MLCAPRTICHEYLSRKGKRHSPLLTHRSVETVHVGPAEIANKEMGAMEEKNKKKQENDLTNRSPLQPPVSQQGQDVGGMLTLPLWVRPHWCHCVQKHFIQKQWDPTRFLIPSWLQRRKGEERGRREKCVCKTASVAERGGVGRTACIVLSQKSRLWDGIQSLRRLELVSIEMMLEWCCLPIDYSRGSTHCNRGRLQEAGRGTSEYSPH